MVDQGEERLMEYLTGDMSGSESKRLEGDAQSNQELNEQAQVLSLVRDVFAEDHRVPSLGLGQKALKLARPNGQSSSSIPDTCQPESNGWIAQALNLLSSKRWLLHPALGGCVLGLIGLYFVVSDNFSSETPLSYSQVTADISSSDEVEGEGADEDIVLREQSSPIASPPTAAKKIWVEGMNKETRLPALAPAAGRLEAAPYKSKSRPTSLADRPERRAPSMHSPSVSQDSWRDKLKALAEDGGYTAAQSYLEQLKRRFGRTPELGGVLLFEAELLLREQRYREAAEVAREAAGVSGFSEVVRARKVAHRAETLAREKAAP